MRELEQVIKENKSIRRVSHGEKTMVYFLDLGQDQVRSHEKESLEPLTTGSKRQRMEWRIRYRGRGTS